MPNTLYTNRRRESRHYLVHDPVTWQADAQRRRNPGELDNVSRGGLAFRTRRKRPLKPGAHVQLVRKADRSLVNCVVVRLRRLPDGQWRVGCRKLDPVESCVSVPDPASGPPVRRIAYARHHPHANAA